MIFWDDEGNDLDDTIQVAKWCEDEGVDAIHVSTGSMFPHPLNPPGQFPLDEAEREYPVFLQTGTYAFRNYLLFRFRLLHPVFRWPWDRTRPRNPDGSFVTEGINAEDARAIKAQVQIPVMVSARLLRARAVPGSRRDDPRRDGVLRAHR